jgi:Holliday junction resolvase RusA-like endonuclease
VEPGIVGGRAVTFHVKLPLPPSANKLFFNVPGKGRVKTRAYKNWRRNAVLSIFAQVRADRRESRGVARFRRTSWPPQSAPSSASQARSEGAHSDPAGRRS